LKQPVSIIWRGLFTASAFVYSVVAQGYGASIFAKWSHFAQLVDYIVSDVVEKRRLPCVVVEKNYDVKA